MSIAELIVLLIYIAITNAFISLYVKKSIEFEIHKLNEEIEDIRKKIKKILGENT
jgi:hypothetical protein